MAATPEHGKDAPSAAESQDPQSTMIYEKMAVDNRISWGESSAPSLPSIDDDPEQVSDSGPELQIQGVWESKDSNPR
jgi:hypothetical protein